jgi:hypothetical protein
VRPLAAKMLLLDALFASLLAKQPPCGVLPLKKVLWCANICPCPLCGVVGLFFVMVYNDLQL